MNVANGEIGCQKLVLLYFLSQPTDQQCTKQWQNSIDSIKKA